MIQLACERLDEDDEMLQFLEAEWENITCAKSKTKGYEARGRNEMRF